MNNKMNYITTRQAKNIISNQTHKMISCINKAYPKHAQKEMQGTIELIEALQRAIFKELDTNNTTLINEFFNKN